MRARLRSAAAAAGLAIAGHASAGEGASDWSRDGAAALRLVAGAGSADGTPVAGLEIRLGPGWKTYWKSPGDSGLPPRFDWSPSENVERVEVLWPLPKRFTDGGGTSIGYSGTVVLPLRIVPRDPGRPVVLVANVDYAVCEKLCMPAQGSARLSLPPGQAPDPLASAQLEGFRGRVPRDAALGAEGPVRVLSAELEAGDRPGLRVTTAGPAGAKLVDLFAAGDEALAAGVPIEVEARPDGTRSWRVPLTRSGDDVGAGGEVTLVAVADAEAIAVPVTLDGIGRTP